MGAELAVTTSNPGTVWLHHFADTIINGSPVLLRTVGA
jgi:hypothetical protein